MFKTAAVLGAGATGHYMACLLAMNGVEVNFCDDERFADALEAVKKVGFITLRGNNHGTGTPKLVTTDFAEAVKGVELIFVHVPSMRQEEIARRIAPYVEDGQDIILFPGNLGSFVFKKVFEEMGVTAKVTLTEKEGNLGPCRLSMPAEVTVGNPLNRKGKVCSLPARDTAKVLEKLNGIFEYAANQNVFEAAMNTGNVVNHVATTTLSAPQIDRTGDAFSLFKFAFTPSVMKCVEKIAEERKPVIEALGWQVHGEPTGMANKIAHIDEHPEVRIFYEFMDGPNALDHRYLHEDCGCGGAFAVSMAKKLGLEMPTLEAFIKIAGVINGVDYFAEGRTLENLGFTKDMTIEEIFAKVE
ncbi:MAG: NAD/NADP octopine/nopaline dehydrogenase family protein [Lachnospiraceae bacterium]|nr:NAD/NADP octopine/nopaline dehydrogenase family protein [Lachnospiraceae bacterium]